MAMYTVKCEECRYKELSEYKHKVCSKCRGAMHTKEVPTIVTKDLKETLRMMGEK